ncbi:sporulation protein [Xanthomonas oryzae pv. oryzicola]|uniref:SPOR domain-containing protein n=1 Tax=Xanthomonas oryzae TaxID=347 RepID=UPI00065524E8|nr:SPOR domain-containing protein [Xanthomonas oryzae]AKN91961.1 sporulation protein [Xanthomonas oryzae pv. oryzicola]AKN95702.1 sporulation protein [Xanthomonas oryzae pv. oryzicola]AKO10925.1 sporulation protein [Xanthomonas oryzae pv. oryzicola]AKO14657.1 sporulation protein [Xanthomonas oryzae pv. oryzicola]
MYVRALIVVLIVLNAGVALWWALQPPPAPPPAPPQPTGVARLELLPTLPGVGGAALPGAAAATGSASAAESESTASATPATPASTPVSAAVPAPTPAAVVSTSTSTPASTTSATAVAAQTPHAAAEPSATAKAAAMRADSVAATATKPSPTTPSPAPERCASLGPFVARADADAALARVRGQASRASVREDKDAGVSTFRVMLPNVGDRAAAQALVKRIAAAGMGDYYVIAQGEDNTVALGQYQSRERAERRQASLVGAGFPAQLVLSGSGQSRWWIDVRSSAATSALQGAAGAARQRSLDCAALR